MVLLAHKKLARILPVVEIESLEASAGAARDGSILHAVQVRRGRARRRRDGLVRVEVDPDLEGVGEGAGRGVAGGRRGVRVPEAAADP